jgi:hypothetical protein
VPCRSERTKTGAEHRLKYGPERNGEAVRERHALFRFADVDLRGRRRRSRKPGLAPLSPTEPPMRIVSITSLFTCLSLALGAGASLSPRVAALGWLLGTALSLAAGLSSGARASTSAEAATGGAVAGGVPILIGCGLATLLGPVAVTGLVASVSVGVLAGVIGGLASRALVRRFSFSHSQRVA